MALTGAEEALVRELIAQNAALLSLADNEATITSKLGATVAELSDLAPASSVSGTDLMLIRQGTTDKSITPAVALAPFFGDAGLAALTGLTPAADRVPYFNGTASSALTPLTGAGRGVISQGSYAAIRALLDLEPGIDVQAFDADLAAIAALATTSYGRGLLTLANAGALGTELVTSAGSSGSRSITIGGAFTIAVQDITVPANSVGTYPYGGPHGYSSWARAWVEGSDAPGDRSVWASLPTLSNATVHSNAAVSTNCFLFSIGF